MCFLCFSFPYTALHWHAIGIHCFQRMTKLKKSNHAFIFSCNLINLASPFYAVLLSIIHRTYLQYIISNNIALTGCCFPGFWLCVTFSTFTCPISPANENSFSPPHTIAQAPCLPFCCKHLWYVKCCWLSLTPFCVDPVNLSLRRRLGAVSSPGHNTTLRQFFEYTASLEFKRMPQLKEQLRPDLGVWCMYFLERTWKTK